MDAPLYGQVPPQYLFSVILQNIRHGYFKLGLTQLRTFMGDPLNPGHLNKNTEPSTTSVALYHPLHRQETSLFSRENPLTSASLYSYTRPHSPAFNTSMNPPLVFQSYNVNSAPHDCSYYSYYPHNQYNQYHYQPVTCYYHHKDIPDYIVIDIPPFYNTSYNGYTYGNLPNYYTPVVGSVDLV